MQRHYNPVNCLLNLHKIHPIAPPLGCGMECILWVQTLRYTLPGSLQWCMQYHVISDHAIIALNCIQLENVSTVTTELMQRIARTYILDRGKEHRIFKAIKELSLPNTVFICYMQYLCIILNIYIWILKIIMLPQGWIQSRNFPKCSQVAKFMGPTWDPPGSCRPQLGPMWAPWNLLSGFIPYDGHAYSRETKA